MDRPKIIIMASKTSAYLEILVKAFSYAELFFIGNKKDSKAINFARRLNLDTTYFPLSTFTKNGRSREDYDEDLGKFVKTKKPDLVVLAGWLHILSQSFLSQLPVKTVINLHAALLPDNHKEDEIV